MQMYAPCIETHFRLENTNTLKENHISCKQYAEKNKSNNIYTRQNTLQVKIVTRDKTGSFILIKGSINQ